MSPPANAALSTEEIGARVEAALVGHDRRALLPLFAPEARWGSCTGGDQIVEWMQAVAADGVDVTLTAAAPHEDRIVLSFALRRTSDDESSLPADRPHHQVWFVVDGMISEIQDAPDEHAARQAHPGASPPSPLGPRTQVADAATIFPVRELATALEHYRRLGFTVRAYEGGGYGFVERGAVELHLAEVPDLDPGTNPSGVYIMVENADDLAAEWRAAAVEGRVVDVVDTNYGMREGAHIDPDGNLIRFGTPKEC